MTKSERKEVEKLMLAAQMGVNIGELGMIGYAARGISALVRASKSGRNELITIASGIPAIVKHSDFVV